MSETTLPLLRVPEFIIHDTIEKSLNLLRNDYTEQSDKTSSILYKLVGTLNFQRYNFWEQSQSVFLKTKQDSRYLEVDLMFNMSRDGAPTIHVTTPSETPGLNGIGNDRGYQQEIVYDDDSYRNVYTRRYKATYDIVITSDNSNEVILIYHILRALLTSLTAHFHLSGLENLSFSGQDLSPYMEQIPKNFFVRAIRMSLEYETSTLSLSSSTSLNSIEVIGTPVIDTSFVVEATTTTTTIV